MPSSRAGSSQARSGLWTIPAWRPFADDLAAGLLARHPDPMALAHVLVFLPTRRAIRALTDAFVRESEGRALLLPRMVPAGDVEPDDLAGWELGPLVSGLQDAADLRPAVEPLARQIALAKLLSSARHVQAAEALLLAGQLGAALDTLEIEGRRPADIAAAVPEGSLQNHWEINAKILQAVLTHWPGLLDARGQMDAARRRNLQLSGLAQRWAAAPPPFPVLLAGFANAPPAVARLARTIARLPDGLLVMPGLDRSMSAEGWAQLRGSDEMAALETHPHYGMARLLDAADLSPLEALDWPWQSARIGSTPARAALLAHALRPPQLPADNPGLQLVLHEALAGVRMVEAANAAEEALLIALALRQVVERPGRTAALVTPDRALAARVTVQLQRFGIVIDDSAGKPLQATGPGSLMVALAAAAQEGFAPVALLSLLQHPLVRAGAPRLGWLNQVRALDRLALRGIRPGPGLAGVATRLRNRREVPDSLRDWWADEVTPLLSPLEPLPRTADALLDRLRGVAEALAGEALWAGDAGRALARLFEALEQARPDLAGLPTRADDAAAFLTGLLSGESVRPRGNRHPQLAIWGPLEARLQSADLLVMGGLNEGSWPGHPAADPFLAPAIRRALGLPGLARRTGLQAHDFASGLGAAEVLLTRSVREGSAPAVASRFWQRLLAAAGTRPDGGSLSPSADALLQAVRALRTPTSEAACPRPAPAPPAADRPRSIRVTEVAILKADPFAFYARRMLGLNPLDPRDAEPTAGERGQVVHRILERWLDEAVSGPDALAALLDEELLKLGERPEIAALWRPRVQRLVEWVVADTQAQAETWRPVAWEEKGEIVWSGITLKGRVDRIDSSPEGLRIIDYKTGRVPGPGDVISLYQTQLALLAVMADSGQFGVDGAKPVTRLDYLKLSGGRDPAMVKPALGKAAGADAIQAHIGAAWEDYQALVRGWLLEGKPFIAKRNMVYGRAFRDYDHLARVAEWLGR